MRARIGFGPVAGSNRGTADGETAIGLGGDGDLMEWGTDTGWIRSGDGSGVEGDATAFGCTEKVVDLDLVLVEGAMLEREREGSAGGNGEPDVGGERAGIEPCLPQCGDGGECERDPTVGRRGRARRAVARRR
jgi:hypothetical protein